MADTPSLSLTGNVAVMTGRHSARHAQHRILHGGKFDRQTLAPLLRDGVRVGTAMVRITRRRVGGAWQDVLLEVLRREGD